MAAVTASLLIAAVTSAGAAGPAGAEPAAGPDPPKAIESVLIRASASQGRLAAAPHALSEIDAQALRRAGPMVHLSEVLVQVPGMMAANRGNQAQDLQISLRGFGARAGFGVRGLRLVADGIPASGPDGQGQVSHFDGAGAQRVEVLRGPFSVLYGSSSGGVIALTSAPAAPARQEAALDLGSFGLRQARIRLDQPLDGGFDLRLGASRMRIQGFRPHSAADKSQAYARVGWRHAQDSVLLRLDHLDLPAQDPLGLSRSQLAQGPGTTTPQASLFDTRKTTRQGQAGLRWQRQFDETSGPLQEVRVALHAGQRQVQQWLAVPAAAQASPQHGGGVIDLNRRYSGLDARLSWNWPEHGLAVVAGLALEQQHDDRRGYENFTGSVEAGNLLLGQTGRLRRQETNRARTEDGYAQAELTLAPQVVATAGLRSGRVKLATADAFLANGDDSGRLALAYTNPVLGLRAPLARGLQWHASAARGFETPTLAELAYRADGSAGFNTALRPQTSHQVETGLRWRSGPWALDLIGFRADTFDEIGVARNSGGRASFQNLGRTRRQGLELGLDWRPAGPWRGQLALGLLQARYRDSAAPCPALPCPPGTPQTVAGGRIAGAPAGTLWAELAWRHARWGEPALELRALGRIAADDRNTEFAAGHATAALRWSGDLPSGLLLPAAAGRVEWLLRVDNLFNRHAAGSLIVNESNGRFFEPTAPRSLLVALRLVNAR